MTVGTSRVLFLCSGNFYRSRFAEQFFNLLASRRQMAWQAESRGFRLSPNNLGAISPHAIAGLQLRGLDCAQPQRMPAVVESGDFAAFELVIAVKEAEHRAKMLARFPAWADRIQYWHIDDVDCAEPHQALPELEKQVRDLIDRLQLKSLRESQPSQRAG